MRVGVIAPPKQRERDPSPIASVRSRLHQSHHLTIDWVFVLTFAGQENFQPIDISPGPCVLPKNRARATHAAEARLFCRRVAATVAPDCSCKYRDKDQCR